jgi:TldD protein
MKKSPAEKILVGRGFSRDINAPKELRLQPLKYRFLSNSTHNSHSKLDPAQTTIAPNQTNSHQSNATANPTPQARHNLAQRGSAGCAPAKIPSAGGAAQGSPSRAIAKFAAIALASILLLAPLARAQQSASKSAAEQDTVLAAMSAELQRSKSRLKMDNLAAPYYVEYHVTDTQQFYAEASFGALRLTQTTHSRSLRVVVRVGDYKQDSYGPGGQGVADVAPLEDDPTALRRALWLATDRAYKSATEALAGKKANQAQFTGDQGYDDFAHATPLQSLDPLVKLNVDPKPWTDMLVKSTSLYRTDPKLESLSATARFVVTNKYFVNSEGTVTRQGAEVDNLSLDASTQAADGMTLQRNPYFAAAKLADLPSPEKFQPATADILATLKALRDAPVVEEDYLGPVIFTADSANGLFGSLIANNVTGDRPRTGDTARTAGNFASSYKSRVLPTFLSVADDPTATTFGGKSLIGSYNVDDEGVRAQKVPLVDKGILNSYLLGRQPIRDFPESNGHGRAGAGQPPRPSISNLIVTASESSSPDELKAKLIALCRDANLRYGYLAQTLGVSQSIAGAGRGRGGPAFSFQIYPVLLYRVYVSDGHQELVRGATFNQLDTRALRTNIVAAGDDPLVDNRAGGIPTSVVSPSLLFDELEIRRSSDKNEKLPEYPAPDIASAQPSR